MSASKPPLATLEKTPEALNAAASQHPRHAPTRLFLGVAQLDAGLLDDALASFQQTLELQPTNQLAPSYQALALLKLEQFDAARAIWKKHGFASSSDFRIRLITHLEHQWLEEKRWFVDQPVELPAPLKLSTGKALKYFYKRKYRQMLQHLPPEPVEDDMSAFLAALGRELLFDYSGAMQFLEPLQARRSEWPDPLVALHARLLVRLGQINQATCEFEKVLILGPEDFGTNYYLGICGLAYHRPDWALDKFRQAFVRYMVDTQEFQWWQATMALMGEELPRNQWR